jgi:hypothetical protein
MDAAKSQSIREAASVTFAASSSLIMRANSVFAVVRLLNNS